MKHIVQVFLILILMIFSFFIGYGVGIDDPEGSHLSRSDSVVIFNTEKIVPLEGK